MSTHREMTEVDELDVDALEKLKADHRWLAEWSQKRSKYVTTLETLEFEALIWNLGNSIDRLSDFCVRRRQ